MSTFSLDQTIKRYCDQHNLLNNLTTVIVGFSGGPDSTFLLHFFALLQKQGVIQKVIAAHLDHEWRNNSGQDEQFCRSQAQNFGILYTSSKISELAVSLKYNGSQEEVGRNARRYFLNQVRTQQNADVVALAHHADDQQETFFIRLIRGASLSGLTGMKPRKDFYIRPLLNTSKKEILTFLHHNDIPYIIDPTNTSPLFLRNKIRNTVLPALTETDARFPKTLNNTLARLQETEHFLNKLTEEHFSRCTTLTKEETYTLNLTPLFNIDPIIYKRILLLRLCKQKIPFTPSTQFFNEITRFLRQPRGGKHHLHTSWYILKKNHKASLHLVT